MRALKAAALAAAASCLLAGPAAAQEAGCADGRTCERRVAVWGKELRLRIHPGGPLTVLLEAGSGYGADEWNRSAAEIAQATGATVVAYDRAGMGESEGLDTDYDVHEEVARLHAALYALGLDRRVVLAGHSYGGYLIHLYANLYPGDVRGLVYIDANTPAGIDAIGGPAQLAEAGIKRNDVPDPTPQQRALLRQSRAAVRTHEILRRYPPVCGVPVAVIVAGKRPPEARPEVLAGLDAAYRALASLSGGRLLIAADSGHMIPLEQPRIVIEAVRDVAAQAPEGGARTGTPGRACAP